MMLCRAAQKSSVRPQRNQQLLRSLSTATTTRTAATFFSPHVDRHSHWQASPYSICQPQSQTCPFRHLSSITSSISRIPSLSGCLPPSDRLNAAVASTISCRYFSSGRGGGRRQSKQQQDDGPLSNEQLIRALMRHNDDVSSPKDVQVRLVVDAKERGQKSLVEVVSLDEAIRTAVDRQVDLIGIQLNQEVPVVRATLLSKFQYQKSQAQDKKKAGGGNGDSSSKAIKRFRFRAGIDDHDLLRKVKDISKFLAKGQRCDFTILSKRWQSKEAGQELVDRIAKMVQEVGQFRVPPDINEAGTFIKVSMVPLKKK